MKMKNTKMKKVYNHTTRSRTYPKIPTELLERLFECAAEFMQVDIDKVPMIVQWNTPWQGFKNNFEGWAKKCKSIAEGTLQGATSYKKFNRTIHKPNGGYFVLALNRNTFKTMLHMKSLDGFENEFLTEKIGDKAFAMAIDIFETITHELGHINDYQKNRNLANEQNLPWSCRSCEKSVFEQQAANGYDRYGKSGNIVEQVDLPEHTIDAILELTNIFLHATKELEIKTYRDSQWNMACKISKKEETS